MTRSTDPVLERHFFFPLVLLSVTDAVQRGLLIQEEKCECNLPLYNQLFDNLTVADQGASGPGFVVSPGFSHFSGRLQYYGSHLYNPVNGIQPLLSALPPK